MRNRNLFLISIIFLFVSFSILPVFAQKFTDIRKDVYNSVETSINEKEHFSLSDMLWEVVEVYQPQIKASGSPGVIRSRVLNGFIPRRNAPNIKNRKEPVICPK